MIVIAALLAVASLAGCGLFQSAEDKKIERALNESAEITVYVRNDVTAQQKTAIEARLRTVPGMTDVVFEDHEAAYAKMKTLSADTGAEIPDYIEPAVLPESFVLTMKDQAAVRKVRDSAVPGELEALPGVQYVGIHCTTVDECKKNMSRLQSPAPSVT
jgi:cell division transport system permease protein